MIWDNEPPIEEMRIVKRVKTEKDANGVKIVNVIGERIEFRRQGQINWQSPDIIIEKADDDI